MPTINRHKNVYKKVYTLVLLATCFLIIAALSACKKEIYNSFAIYPSQVPFVLSNLQYASINAESRDTITANLNIDQQIKQFAGNQYNLDNVGTIKLNALSLHLDRADEENNFAKFSSISISIIGNNSGELEPMEIARTKDLNTYYTDALILEPLPTASLMNHLRGDKVYYIVSCKLRDGLSRPLTGTLTAVYYVD